jgi:hypothetical protein
MMTISEAAEMVRLYEATEGTSSAGIYGMKREAKRLVLTVDNVSGLGHLARQPVEDNYGRFETLGGREIVTGKQL